VQALESIKDLSKHKNSSRQYFGHRWSMHFACANGFSKFCHAFFGWGFILGRDAYRWSPSFGRCPCCFGHFIFMCSSLTFLSHMDNTSFFPISFGRFQQESYANIWGHYRSKIVGVFSGPLRKMLSLTIDILWWYMPFFYEGLCPIYFFWELGFGGSLFVI